MKALEIFFRLLDKLISAIQNRKNQDERDELEASPAEWFTNHFDGVSPDKSNKTDKT